MHNIFRGIVWHASASVLKSTSESWLPLKLANAIGHAEGALAYCDLFLTERSLSTLVKSEMLAFGKFFDCMTFHDAADALKALE